ncbi:MAG: cyclic nucleotide-binding domain-containing protein [Actinomycetota bacterium]
MAGDRTAPKPKPKPRAARKPKPRKASSRAAREGSPKTHTMPLLGGVHSSLRTRVRKRGRARGVHAWEAIDRSLNPATFRPALRTDIELIEFAHRDGERYAMIKSPQGPSYMRLSEEERFVYDMMDGTRTVKEIVVAHFQRYGTFSLSQVADLVDELYRNNFFTAGYVDVAEEALAVKRATRSHLPGWMRMFRDTRRIESRNAYKPFDWMYRHGGNLFFTKPVAIVGAVLSLVGLVTFIALLREGKFSLLGDSAATGVLVLYGIQLFSTFIHESGHALGNVHSGRRINAAGFMLYLGIPAFFIETTDMWMAQRKQRLVATWAGPFSECIMAGAASIIAITLPASGFTAFLFRFAVLSYIAIGQNLIPFLRLDGYYILMDFLDEANLRERSFDFIREDLIGKIRKREKFSRQERIFTGYGILAVIFTALAVLFSIGFWTRIFSDAVESAWRAGLVPRVMITALLLLIVAPILRGLARLARRGVRRLRRGIRSLRRVAQKHWRVEAADLFRNLPLTEDLDEDALAEITEHVSLQHLNVGQAVIREGERGDRFYVVRSGTLVVSQLAEDGSDRLIRKVERGRSFGEVALLEGTARTATVRAVTAADVFWIDKGTFDRALGSRVEVRDGLRSDLQVIGLVRSLEPFRTLDDADAARLAKGSEWLSVAPGERIVKQGDEARSFFVVASGQVEVVENRRVRGRLGPGSYFGEVALLADTPRTATVRAVTPTRVLELDRTAFDRVLAKSFRRGKLAPSRSLARDMEH